MLSENQIRGDARLHFLAKFLGGKIVRLTWDKSTFHAVSPDGYTSESAEVPLEMKVAAIYEESHCNYHAGNGSSYSFLEGVVVKGEMEVGAIEEAKAQFDVWWAALMSTELYEKNLLSLVISPLTVISLMQDSPSG